MDQKRKGDNIVAAHIDHKSITFYDKQGE